MRKLHTKVHKHLKLRHHRHTGRVLHHKHTSYRGLAVVLVLAGIVMMAATIVQRAAADVLMNVGGTVLAPVPNAPATITTPVSGEVLSSNDTLVAGTCPMAAPQVAIVLKVDGKAVGSAMCNGNNDFALPVQLTQGAHAIVAETHTITAGRGVDSQPVKVMYAAMHTTKPSATPTVLPQTLFSVLTGGSNAAWDGVIEGGNAPYNVLIEWGDGTRKQYTVSAGNQHFDHQYHTLQSYNARIAVVDADGQSIQQQYATVAYTTLTNYAAAVTGKSPFLTPTIAGLYGLFLTVSSVCMIVWIEARHAARQETMEA